MKNCPICKQSNDDDAAYCLSCGSELPQQDDKSTDMAEPKDPLSEKEEPKPSVSGAALFSPSLLGAGVIVDGKYSIERLLGEGGMGIVYVARDIHTQAEVVIKAIRSEYAHRQEFRNRILAEGRALASIDHVNVVRLNAVVVEPEAMYLVMQFIDGESLDRSIERHVSSRTPMSFYEVVRIFRQVVEGVGAAHREGVIHRDIKPANILIRRRDGVAKVTDFGIAKAEEDAKAGRGQTKGIIGSLLYMAPEQLLGRKDIDKRVDIYQLGILLYELLMGRVPFDAPSEFEIMKRHLEEPVPSVCAVRADVPGFIDEIIRTACAKNRDQRFTSAEDLLTVLDKGMATVHIQSTTPGAGPPAIAFQPIVHLSQPVVPVQSIAPVTQPAVPLAPTTPQTGPMTAPPEQVSSESVPEPEEKSRLMPMILALGALGGMVGVGLGLALAMGWIGYSKTPTVPSARSAPIVAKSVPEVPKADAAVAKDPLSVLEGRWATEGELQFDAVKTGRKVDFHIRNGRVLQDQGYIENEVRFTLTEVPGTPNVFNLEDAIRPKAPTETPYDLSKSRTTCQEVWSKVNGEQLQARLTGNTLVLDMAKLTPHPSMFHSVGGKVDRCDRLRESKASKIREVLNRVSPQ